MMFFKAATAAPILFWPLLVWAKLMPRFSTVAARPSSSIDLTSSFSAASKSARAPSRTSVAPASSFDFAAIVVPSVAISSSSSPTLAVEESIVALRSSMERPAVSIAYPLSFSSSSQKAVYSSIEDLSATIDSSTANVGELEDEIATLGTTIAAKSKELAGATEVREGARADFEAAEKELVKSIDELGRAATVLKRGMSFAQTSNGQKRIGAAVAALKNIIDAQWVESRSRRKLKAFLQASAQSSEDEDDDLSLSQPQAKQVAYESS